MTRPEKISKRKAFNKEIRAHAAHEQSSFATVLTRTLEAQKTRSHRAMMNLPSHPPRTTKRVGLNEQSVEDCSDNIGDDEHTQHELICEHSNGNSPFGLVDEEEKRKNSISFVIDLMGIAKPAKPKGVAKEYEVVGKVRDVIALEDDIEYEYEADGDEWEEVEFDYGSKGGGNSVKRSYSAALRGR
ncbi:hypothetical protein AGABI1DRAFT_129368 [Agaricus bisporus var. burnettii JB137-S8]|uniref:Uncharacterized protein n=1 Tax=Agaricus bisporus var. burnettii (strain JB137-S8 / ATCC MYA-4627 / FGSC 10392) TaxID=597362 RepID=K5WS69_AGABU|nr:uncharacterized protein AGABI1DRAFT_129368 [Agaricus bisporus var. burnettii JB137-S8]EKM78246.1 hypothetical protein AGABI1DRAFT_129368 [Agaricus bisporus var. burnettii JB137-S8]